MVNKEKVYIHWDLFRFLEESELGENCIAIADYNNDIFCDLMLYLYKDNNNYIVDVYKSNQENDFDRYTFEKFETARDFLDNLSWEHPEYRVRPYVKIK